MAVTRDWVLYGGDTVDFSSASTDNVFFNEDEAAAGGGVNETNMPIASQLPREWNMKVHEIQVLLDATELAATSLDALDALHQSLIEIKIAKKRVFIAPVKCCLGPGNLFHPAVESNAAGMTANAQGFIFRNPLIIPGGTPFEVILRTGVTAATSSTNEVTIALIGEMTMPD